MSTSIQKIVKISLEFPFKAFYRDSHTNPYIFVGHAHTKLGAPVVILSILNRKTISRKVKLKNCVAAPMGAAILRVIFIELCRRVRVKFPKS